MDDLIREALAAGVPIWVLAVLLGVVTVSQLFPRVLGPISQAIYAFAEKRRQAAADREDADIAEWRRQVVHLAGSDRQKQERLEAIDRHLWMTVRPWMLQAMDDLPADYPPPPSIYPPT